MGKKIEDYDIKLYPQHPPIVAFDPRRYVSLDEDMLIFLQEKLYSYSGDDFEIRDQRKGRVIYRINGKLGPTQKKTLVDLQGQPIANIKHPWFNFFNKKYHVYSGSDSNELLFTIRSQGFGRKIISAEFKNKLSDEQQSLYLLCNRDMIVIFKGDPDSGGVAVAKVSGMTKTSSSRYRKTSKEAQGYHVAISAGVEVPLIVFMLVAYDESFTKGG
jgi:uncharacterized protein YxjI